MNTISYLKNFTIVTVTVNYIQKIRLFPFKEHWSW